MAVVILLFISKFISLPSVLPKKLIVCLTPSIVVWYGNAIIFAIPLTTFPLNTLSLITSILPANWFINSDVVINILCPAFVSIFVSAFILPPILLIPFDIVFISYILFSINDFDNPLITYPLWTFDFIIVIFSLRICFK